MKSQLSKFIVLFLSIVILNFASAFSQNQSTYNFPINITSLQKDFQTWWNYNYQNIILSENYTALDTSGASISSESFFQLLCTGEYITIRIEEDQQLRYRLYKLDERCDKDIKIQSRYFGESAYQKFKLEGKEVTDLTWTDLSGKVYTKENTLGKIIILKCWFINCLACVKEMPELNKIVKSYKNRKDILFLSLAFDPKEDLIKFLPAVKFDYATIPISQTYLEKQLKVNGYPTHFIIGRNGLISKVTNRGSEIENLLKIELAK